MSVTRTPRAPIFSTPSPTAAATSTTPTTPTTSTATTSARRFEFKDGASSKFWEVRQQGADLHIGWGRIGTAGQSQTKTFADGAAAAAAMGKLVAEKVGKGYVDVDASAGGNAIDVVVAGGGNSAVLGGAPTGGAGVATGGVSALSLRAGTGKLWSDLDNDGKANALAGDEDLVGATWSEDVDVAKLPPAQKAVVDKIVKLAASQLNDNDDAENQPNNIVRIGEPEPSVNIVVDAKGDVLGVSVSFFQRGGAFEDEDNGDDDDGDGRDTWYKDAASAKAAGVDTSADVSWSISEPMVFDAKGKELRDASGHHWEWSGW
jgi:predicted DNA-binding WGR domain protein